MILAFAIINNFGKARMLKYYRDTSQQQQQRMVKELYETLITRAENASSLVDAHAWFEGVPGARVVYRLYATLYFCMIIDGSESELGILDLIQVLVETLDRHFKNVCELDIIFNAEKAHWIIDEMIVGGLVVETNPSSILEIIDAQAKLMHQQTELGSAASAAASRLDAFTKGIPPRPAF
mmetsp:Transcript_38732/g.102166  ORF Transcript_38732/g.102166 Transcript_38732/m.102166 type:complete len:180 (-) Transcript_38732:24-563(-)